MVKTKATVAFILILITSGQKCSKSTGNCTDWQEVVGLGEILWELGVVFVVFQKIYIQPPKAGF
jgi:hypothetical protein